MQQAFRTRSGAVQKSTPAIGTILAYIMIVDKSVDM